MSLLNENNLRMVNLFFSLATIVPCLILFIRTTRSASQSKMVRNIMAYIFFAFFVTSIVSSIIGFQVIYTGRPEDVTQLSNIRNLLKNSAIFIMAWGFMWIEFKTERGRY